MPQALTQDMGMPHRRTAMNYATIKYCDIANGEGVRTSLRPLPTR